MKSFVRYSAWVILVILLSAVPGVSASAQSKPNPESTLVRINLDAYLDGIIAKSEAPYREHRRWILGVYDAPDPLQGFAFNPIQYQAATVLEYYGYQVHPINLRFEELPDEKEMEKYDVIISWFERPMIPHAIQYLIWLEKQVAKGKKLIVLGHTGMEINIDSGDSYPYDLKARLLRLVDLEFRGFSRRLGPKVYVEDSDDDMIGFERELREHPGDYAWIVPYEDKKVTSWLTIGHDDFPGGESSVVTTSPRGGYVMNGYVTWQEPDSEDPRYRWIINPFHFFREILGGASVVVPDPTTKNGKRIFFSHVDGDSFHSFSQVERGKYSSEIILDFLTNEIPDIPIGISFIVAEIDAEGIEGSDPYMPHPDGKKHSDGSPIYIRGHRGNERLLETARKIAALPNVELASHSYHHPYIWYGKKKTSAYKRSEFDLEFEIRESVDYINRNVAPEGKKVEVFFWTGNTTPGVEAFRLLDEIGVLNLNGGDSVYDAHYNSITSVSPYGRKTGPYWQIFTCQSNENLYTNLWRSDFNGLENVIETMERTERPRRLQCANLYYHFYTGDRLASMRAIRNVYRWIREQDYEWVFPSEYVRIAQGFYSTRIFEIAEQRYAVANRGALNTLRLDEGDVDMEKSEGIVELHEVNDSTYITLDPDVKYPIVQVE